MKKLDSEFYKKIDIDYENNKKEPIISNAISNLGLRSAFLNRFVINKHDFIFSNEISEIEATDQKRTGRCYIFAGLNMIRPKIIEDLKLDDFEFSESYLYFYDIFEKSNYFLQKIIDTKEKEISDRDVVDSFMEVPDDGGSFESFYYLVNKYGLVPKTSMNETHASENSDFMLSLLEKYLKKFALLIRKENDLEKIEEIRYKALFVVYDILCKSIGKPIDKFDFKYIDKDDNFHIEKNLSPIDFYEKYIGNFFENKVRLINDPRHPFRRILLDSFNKTAADMPDMEAINIDMDTISMAVRKSIKDEIPVWFSCDMNIDEDSKNGILDESLFNLDEIFASDFDFSKADRIDSFYSYACHAMTILGFNKNDKNVDFWKVVNSWGDESGKKGFFSMSDGWFRDNCFEFIVDKKFLTKKTLAAFDKEKISYKKFDPLFKALSHIK